MEARPSVPPPATAAGVSRSWSALDGYRALAIFIVMLVHARHSEGYPEWLRPADPFIRGGVTAFMVLSGFLITRSLLNGENRVGSLGIGAFLARQAVRFYVPVVGYLGMVCAIWGWREGFEWDKALRVLWMDPRTADGPYSTGHLYSLAAQMQFCLWWPVALRVMRPGRRLVPVTFLVLAAVAWRWMGKTWALERGEIDIRTDFVFAGLLSGAWWAVAAAEGWLGWIARVPRRWLAGLACVGAVGVLLTRSPSAFLGFLSPELREWVAPWREVAFVAFLVRVVAGLKFRLVLGWLVFLLYDRRHGLVARVLSWPGIAWLGRISFSVYLWQNVFCFSQTGTVLDRYPWNLLASIVCGAVAYALIEKPSLRWRSRVKRLFEPSLCPRVQCEADRGALGSGAG